MANKKEYFGKTDLLFLVNLISEELKKYIKAVEGKGLSTNDFTNELKEKLEDIENIYAPLANPTLTGTVTIPTAAEGTSSQVAASTAFVTNAVAKAIGQITGLNFVKVNSYEELPTKGAAGTIYLVPAGKSGDKDYYDEYFWDGEKYELFGSTRIDLSNYLQVTDVVEMETSEVQAAWNTYFPA